MCRFCQPLKVLLYLKMVFFKNIGLLCFSGLTTALVSWIETTRANSILQIDTKTFTLLIFHEITGERAVKVLIGQVFNCSWACESSDDIKMASKAHWCGSFQIRFGVVGKRRHYANIDLALQCRFKTVRNGKNVSLCSFLTDSGTGAQSGAGRWGRQQTSGVQMLHLRGKWARRTRGHRRACMQKLPFELDRWSVLPKRPLMEWHTTSERGDRKSLFSMPSIFH